MKRAGVLFGFALLAAEALLLAGCPTTQAPAPYEPSQEVLDLEEHVLVLLNDERADAGLAALVMNEDLRLVARAHSQDMATRGFFSHTNPDGSDPFERFAAAGITYSWAGENIAMNNNPEPGETAVAGWMNSPSHRDNILRPQFNRIGVGVADAGAGLYYLTLDFIGTGAKRNGSGETAHCGTPQE